MPIAAEALIEAYAEHFFGYGRWDAPVWFIGTEEAGNPTPEHFNDRLNVWVQRGQRELEDAPTFYPLIGQTEWHGEHAQLQETWRQLIRMLLLARGQPDTEQALLEYQQDSFGAFSGNVCLTELSPMPALGHRHWPYTAWADAPHWVRSRDTFMHRIQPARFATLREQIAAHRTRAVVFYFWKPRDCAEAIAGGEFQPLIPEKLLGFQRDGTHYFITGHPATGYPDSYFRELGDYFFSNHKQRFAAQEPPPPVPAHHPCTPS